MMTGVAWHPIIDINSVAAKYKRLFRLKGEYKQKNGGGTDYMRKHHVIPFFSSWILKYCEKNTKFF